MESDKVVTHPPGSDGLEHRQLRHELDAAEVNEKGPSSTTYDIYENRSRNPWGLGPLAFGLLVAVITALVVGGAVGGGVSTISKHGKADTTTIAKTITSTATMLPTSYSTTLADFTPPTPTLVSHLSNGCPNLDGKDTNIHLSGGTYTFLVACDTDINAHGAADSTTGAPVEDLVALYAYSLDDCLTACVGYEAVNSTSCKGVSWCHEMSFCIEKYGANCWLKSGSNTGSQQNWTIAATLQD